VLAVGAYSEDGSGKGINPPSDENAPGAGAVYVFVRSAGVWTQTAYVKARNTDAGDAFGTSVALSADGTILAVGATAEASDGTSETNNSASDAGAVYVFQHGATWAQQAYLKASVVNAFDEFGTAVALSGDGAVLAVGASRSDSAATNVG